MSENPGRSVYSDALKIWWDRKFMPRSCRGRLMEGRPRDPRRAEVLRYAGLYGATAAAKKFGCSRPVIYVWRNERAETA